MYIAFWCIRVRLQFGSDLIIWRQPISVFLLIDNDLKSTRDAGLIRCLERHIYCVAVCAMYMLLYIAVWRCVLLYVAVWCCVLLYVAVWRCVLLYVAVWCCVLLCIAVSCCLTLCVAVCCCLVLCVAVYCCILLFDAVCCCMLLFMLSHVDIFFHKFFWSISHFVGPFAGSLISD